MMLMMMFDISFWEAGRLYSYLGALWRSHFFRFIMFASLSSGVLRRCIANFDDRSGIIEARGWFHPHHPWKLAVLVVLAQVNFVLSCSMGTLLIRTVL